MTIAILSNIFSLALQVLIAFLIWRHYQNVTCPVSQRYATFGPRFWASYVDYLVLLPVDLLNYVLNTVDLPTFWEASLLIIVNLAWLFYTVIMHAKYGQTCGKMVCKVKVVNFSTEGPLTYPQALLREGIPFVLGLGLIGYELYAIFGGMIAPAQMSKEEILHFNKVYWLLMSLPILWSFAEILTMLTNDKRRALHDYIAGTIVIRTNVK